MKILLLALLVPNVQSWFQVDSDDREVVICKLDESRSAFIVALEEASVASVETKLQNFDSYVHGRAVMDDSLESHYFSTFQKDSTLCTHVKHDELIYFKVVNK